MEGKRVKSRRKREPWNFDWVITVLTVLAIGIALYGLVFFSMHTRIDITKSDKGEINLIVDYDKDSDYNIPGKDLLPMAKEVWGVIKERLN